MKVIADLQIHSRFARAVSAQMVPHVISDWASKKGIDIVATGDWTHPLWFKELQANLVEAGEGVYKLKSTAHGLRITAVDGSQLAVSSPYFLLSTEISSIYSQDGQTRKIHTLIFSPNLEVCEKINKELTEKGANLISDGRPIVRLSARDVAEIALSIDERCLIIPAHAWTPWFSLYGSKSGFDSIRACFGDMERYIYAIETGLSSDPAMNWRIGELSNRRIVSFSDAHSPQKLGREATVFEISDQSLELSYQLIREAITGLVANGQAPRAKIAHTIEFYPEEGKYHFTGHRNCDVIYSPNETRKLGTICPKCGRPLTVGVMSRVEHLASLEIETEIEKDKFGVNWIHPKDKSRPPYIMMVPLMEILAECLEVGVGTQKVMTSYELLISNFQSEFKILLETDISEIEKIGGARIAEGISKVRSSDISIDPGYDGIFGKVKIWSEDSASDKPETEQETLF
ncbi:endonuclease Q family protein [Patescibacteria group bacterium]|nr:endonuclease Q family protein [Patescibacteria group bacterium]